MAKGDRKRALTNYVEVKERIRRFWEEYPDGAIIVSHAGPIDDFEHTRYRAEIYKHRDDARPSATGHAFELFDPDDMINQTSHEENCETSAVGRALANMGYVTKDEPRPSREEMDKVERHQRLHQRPARPEPAPPDDQLLPEARPISRDEARPKVDQPITISQLGAITKQWKRWRGTLDQSDAAAQREIDEWLEQEEYPKLTDLDTQTAADVLTAIQDALKRKQKETA